MKPSYPDLDDEVLYTLLSLRRKTLGILEQQRAAFGILYVPPHIIHSIESEQEEIAAIKTELAGRKTNNHADLAQIEEIIEPAIARLDASSRALSKLENGKFNVTYSIVGMIVIALSYAALSVFGVTSVPIFANVINITYLCTLILALIFLIYGFFQFITSGGKI